MHTRIIEAATRSASELWSPGEQAITRDCMIVDFVRRSLDMMPYPSFFLSVCTLSVILKNIDPRGGTIALNTEPPAPDLEDSGGLPAAPFSFRARQVLHSIGIDHTQAAYTALLASAIEQASGWWAETAHGAEGPGSLVAMKMLLRNEPVRRFLKVNLYRGVEWFNRERYGDLVFWLFALAFVEIDVSRRESVAGTAEEKQRLFKLVCVWMEAKLRSSYRVDLLLRQLQTRAPGITPAL